jgi:hypothetical protein
MNFPISVISNIRGPITFEIPYTPVLPGYFYIDANFQFADLQHYLSVNDFVTALSGLTITYDTNHPIRVYPGLNTDGTLLDWSALGTVSGLATQGLFLHPFNQ